MDYLSKLQPPAAKALKREIALVCASSGGAVSRHLCGLVLTERYRDIVDYQFDYGESFDVSTVNDFIYARQIQSLFNKDEDLDIGVDKSLAAAAKFAEAERMCRRTNSRFAHGSEELKNSSPLLKSFLFGMQRKISRVLGDVPALADLDMRFGPGANTSVRGSAACPRVKLSAGFQCSTELLPLLPDLLAEAPGWCTLHAAVDFPKLWVVDVTLVHGKVSFVPKNAKTFRTIVVEPLLNSFLQKGIGTYLKTRLLQNGCDLFKQDHNQERARKGSIDGSLATLDLSMASDCLSTNVVADLLPQPWFELLSAARTGTVVLPDGTCVKLEKFSSMGNGFTFELESLIFLTAAEVVAEHHGFVRQSVSVFGDDIIVPTACYSDLIELLAFLGFSVNSEKSFVGGPFRESCGSDWLFGFDIRPFYVRKDLTVRHLFTMYNWFTRRCEFALAEAVLPFIPVHLRIYGPDGFGDGHLIGSHSLRLNRSCKRAGYCGGYFDTYILGSMRFIADLPGDAVLPSYSVYIRSGQESATDPNLVRGTRGYKKVSIYTLSTSVFR